MTLTNYYPVHGYCENHVSQGELYKRILNHLAKLAKWLSCVVSTYMYGAFDCMFLICHVRVSEWIQNLMLRARSSLTFRQGSGWIHSETRTWHDNSQGTSCLTVSNGFWRSAKTPQTKLLLSQYFFIKSVRLINAWFVEYCQRSLMPETEWWSSFLIIGLTRVAVLNYSGKILCWNVEWDI